MSQGVNAVTIVGNLGQDPEVRYTQNGSAVCKLRVAVGEAVKVGDRWEERTEWVTVTTFGRTAENVAQYMAKGRQIYAEGRLRTNEWEKDGVKRWSTEVVARRVLFLGGGQGGGERRDDPPASKSYGLKKGQKPQEGGGDDGFYDDDLPF